MARPRSVSLEPDEMVALGEEMIQWVSKHPEILHLSQWYSIEKMFTEKQWEAMQQMAEFLPYYERALKMVGLKYLDKTSNVREGISQRWQRIYFRDLRKQEDADLDAASERAQKVAQSSWTPEMQQKHDAFINQMQSLSSKENIDCNSTNNDKKS